MSEELIGVFYNPEQEVYFVSFPGTKYGSQLKISKHNLESLSKLSRKNLIAKLRKDHHLELNNLELNTRDKWDVWKGLSKFILEDSPT